MPFWSTWGCSNNSIEILSFIKLSFLIFFPFEHQVEVKEIVGFLYDSSKFNSEEDFNQSISEISTDSADGQDLDRKIEKHDKHILAIIRKQFVQFKKN